MIPGSPGGLQAAASAIDAAVGAAAAAPEGVETARATARGGWRGQAAEAFDDSAGQTRNKLTQFIQTAGRASAPLRTYATQLQAAQIQFAAAITPAEKAAAIAMAQAANAQAASAISAIDTDQEEATALKNAIKGTSIATSVTLGSARAFERYQGANATKWINAWRARRGGELVRTTLEVPDRAAEARLNRVAQRIRYGSWALSPVFAGAGQVAADSADPSLTGAQRTGRAIGQGLSVGGASIVGSIAAGALAGSVLPGPGTVVGALGGLAAGVAGSLIAGGAMDAVNDGFVEGFGNAAQSISDTAGSALDKITPW